MSTVTPEQIEKWKENGPVFLVTLNEVDFYYKTITRNDYIEISQAQTVATDYELITVKKCLLNEIDESILDTKAGIVSILYEQIMLKSGFVNVESQEL